MSSKDSGPFTILIVVVLLFFVLASGYFLLGIIDLRTKTSTHENLTEVNTQLTAKTIAIEEIAHSNEQLDSDLASLAEQYARLQDEHTSVKTAYEALQQTHAAMSEELVELKRNSGSDSTLFQIMETRFFEMEDDLLEANEEISSLVSKNQELCSRLQSAPDYQELCN